MYQARYMSFPCDYGRDIVGDTEQVTILHKRSPTVNIKRMIVMTAAMLLLAGCGTFRVDGTLMPTGPADPESTPSQEPAPTSEGTPPGGMPPLAGGLEWASVEVPKAGVVFDVPAGWLHLDPDWRWTPAESSSLHIGFKWMAIEPPVIVEAVMLPDNAVALSREVITLSWTDAEVVTVEVYAPAQPGSGGAEPTPAVARVEVQVIVLATQESGLTAYGFSAAGATLDEAASLRDTVIHMADSLRFTQ
jgi:hypothetical protein